MLVLRTGIPTLYPTVNPEIDNEFCISVIQKNEDQYVIHDEDFTEPLTMDKAILMNSRFDLGNWYCTKRLPKNFNKWDDNLLVDLSIFSPEKDDSVPDLYHGDDLDSDNEDPPSLYPISEEESEMDDRDEMPDLQDNPDDDTVMDWSDSNMEINERPYCPIGDILGETVALILDASEPYPGDSLYPQSRRHRFSVN